MPIVTRLGIDPVSKTAEALFNEGLHQALAHVVAVEAGPQANQAAVEFDGFGDADAGGVEEVALVHGGEAARFARHADGHVDRPAPAGVA